MAVLPPDFTVIADFRAVNVYPAPAFVLIGKFDPLPQPFYPKAVVMPGRVAPAADVVVNRRQVRIKQRCQRRIGVFSNDGAVRYVLSPDQNPVVAVPLQPVTKCSDVNGVADQIKTVRSSAVFIDNLIAGRRTPFRTVVMNYQAEISAARVYQNFVRKPFRQTAADAEGSLTG